jgi:Putative metal-binding motif
MKARCLLPSLFAVVVLACSGSSSPAPVRTSNPPADGSSAPDGLDASDHDSANEHNSVGDHDAANQVFTAADGGNDAGPTGVPCQNPPNVDGDHDGFTGAQGDCNDCDPNVNPAAYDVPGNGVDEDCDGTADDEPTGCDTGLAVDSMSALDAAKSLGLCRRQADKSWGVVSAAWVFPDGTTATTTADPPCMVGAPPNPLSHGILTSFGASVMPRAGASMVAISSGVARSGSGVVVPAPGMGSIPDAEMCTQSAPPPGFPTDAPSCPMAHIAKGNVHDGMALELQIKIPSNARQLSFDFDFYTEEYPNYICSTSGYDDQFVSLLWSSAAATPANHNVSFDSRGDAVSVDTSLLEACQSTTVGSVTYSCPLGTTDLDGTGFLQTYDAEGHLAGGATGWLRTQAAVVPGETIKLRFAIWDTFDELADSTTLLDNLTWDLSSGTAVVDAGGAPVPLRPPR